MVVIAMKMALLLARLMKMKEKIFSMFLNIAIRVSFIKLIQPTLKENLFFAEQGLLILKSIPIINIYIYIYINRFQPESRVVIFGGQQATQAFVIASYD